MHFPWDANQRPKADENDFDHGPYEAMRAYATGFEVKLWTFSKAREFCRERYPDVWTALEAAARPVMRIDVLRWALVHHFGGIYWQMNTTPLLDMDAFLPAPGKSVRLFTEFNLAPEQCRAMAAEPIRNGEPEEPVRVLIQAFSALPGAPFIRQTLDFLLDRVCRHVPRKDYDILYITGNAAVSTAYDRFGKNDTTVERLDLGDSRRMIKWHYRGSWRTDAGMAAASRQVPPPALAPRMNRWPGLAGLYYRLIRRHPHESMLAQQDAVQPRASCLPQVGPWMETRGLQTVCEAPSGMCGQGGGKIRYFGGDPNRAVVRVNRKRTKDAAARFRHVNMLFSRFPPVDLFICPGFLEWLSFTESFRVLRRIAASQPRYLALTGYRLLNENWDAALGDFRPINARLAPFSFPEPVETIKLAQQAGGRPDRCLMIWPWHDLLACAPNCLKESR